MVDDRLGRVAAVHPEDHSVDLVMTDDGTQLVGVQVMSVNGSTKTGLADLPVPAMPASGNVWDLTQQTDQDVLAVVAKVGNRTYVRGFLLPQINQMTFATPGRRIDRHGSDVYEMIEPNGDYEHYHPSGTYVRIAASPAHQDLTGQDYDGLWKIGNNTSAAVHYHITVANAGAQVADIDIDPSGNVAVQCNGNVAATIGGDLTATVTGATSITSTGDATLKAPTITLDASTVACTHDLSVGGSVTAAGNVTGGGISLTAHTHPVSGSSTGAPVPGS